MKKSMWILIGGVLATTITAVIVLRQTTPTPPPPQSTAGIPETPPLVIRPQARAITAPSIEPAAESQTSELPAPPPPTPTNISASIPTPAEPELSPLVQTLVSPHATYAQKQEAWKQLRDHGELDQAVTELQQAVKVNPANAEYSAALGETYLQKLQTTPDVRDQNVLAMKADQSFDTALNADSSNWDARFWKARALSFWPAEFNKSQEVMQLYSTLIDQQEAEPPQPQFAKTYVYLGEQYQKAGYNDMAVDMWKRGAALYPSDQGLQAKLAPAK
ncbi:MAG TPA: tetratricopeptide repeat protein [Verrucomicrobiae bacterium]|nr:tetratricopeptide repeat protein [Verrucomicrobiae bacterium]